MIIKKRDGWYVHSEKGKNLGGPYRNRSEAVRRLQQVEYFKHQKTAGLFSVNKERQAKLLVGRANAGDSLTAKEQALLKQLGPLPTKNTFDKERFWASPLGRVAKGVITAGTIAGSIYATRKVNEFAPKILSPEGYAFYQKALEKFTPKTVKQLAELPITKTERIAGGIGLLSPVAVDLVKPTIDRARYPGSMMAQAKKDKKTDSGIDAQLRSQLKTAGKLPTVLQMVVDNVDLVNELPVGEPKKKEELLEALKKVEGGSKASTVFEKVSKLDAELAGKVHKLVEGDKASRRAQLLALKNSFQSIKQSQGAIDKIAVSKQLLSKTLFNRIQKIYDVGKDTSAAQKLLSKTDRQLKNMVTMNNGLGDIANLAHEERKNLREIPGIGRSLFAMYNGNRADYQDVYEAASKLKNRRN